MRYLSSSACGLAVLVLAGCASSSGWQPLVGSHAGTPAGYSAALGVGRVLKRDVDSTKAHARADLDVFALVEPGSRAGRVSVGLGNYREHSVTKHLVNTRVTALRRWSDGSIGNYLGVEVEAETIEEGIALGFRVGLFSPMVRRRGDRALVFAIDFPAGW
jgi:hypothetical protein